jgi:hypothetical protein
MNEGRCLCGQISWQLEGPLELMCHCHCSRCRKSHGVPFATYVGGPEHGLRLRGLEHVVRWQSSPGFSRCFCRDCGSVVPSEAAFDGRVFVPAGNFTEDPGVRPIAHIFVGSKAPWFELSDELARFDAYPEGFDAPPVADRPPLDPAGAVRGSCLCGAVTFVVEGKPLRAVNCHCGRCRRARSAAHAANLFTAADGVKFTRGEDNRSSYKLPEARFFTQVFCRTCGSAMPRIDRERGIAVIPMGSLDDDPGIRPQYHIYVGSKAPWFEIADELPRYDEAAPSR